MYFNEENNYFNLEDNNYIDFNVNSIEINRNDKSNLEEGFNKGNLFLNTYSKYKNHIYNLKVNNKKDELLYKIQIYNFALKDLTLYLDTHTNDKEKLEKFIEYRKIFEELKKEYINNYGPLCTLDVNNNNRWSWVDNPWPWDKGGNY